MEVATKDGAVQVLVVDDSALMRNLVSRIVESSPDLTVAATAMNGKFALSKIETCHPHVIVLDIEMPEMNGIEFLRARKEKNIEIPVVILSSLAQKGAAVTMEALGLGASDFIMKPSGSISEDIHLVGSQLIEQLRHYGRAYQRKLQPGALKLKPGPREPEAPIALGVKDEISLPADFKFRPIVAEAHSSAPPAKVQPEAKPGPLEIIALGISTGGPNALRKVFAGLSANLRAPILVVQHMPAGFTTEFAKSLDRICALEVKEAADGDVVKPGRVLIAPGDQHMRIEKKSLATVVRLDSGPTVNGHRPSADVLFESVGQAYGNRALAVIMTGMGRDGAQQIAHIYKAGGICLGQDEASCVVYGMPRVAFENGFITKQVPLEGMAIALNEYSNELGG